MHQRKAKDNNDVPEVDFEGKTFSDKDAIEPGINIFSENDSDESPEDKKLDEDEPTETSSGDSDTMKEGDESVEFSFDEKVSPQPVKAEKSDDEKSDHVIEANFGNGNKSLKNILTQQMRPSHLKLILPGGKQIKLSNNHDVDEHKSTMKFADPDQANVTTDHGDAVTVDVKDANINKTAADSIARNIQNVDFTTKKTKTAHFITSHNKPTHNKSKITGSTRSFYGDGFGGEGGEGGKGFGGFGGMGDFNGMSHGGNFEGHRESSEGHGGGMSLWHGNYEGGHTGIGGHGMLPMENHDMMPTDGHGAMMEGHTHQMPALHNTGAVAMIPALLHHDRSKYDHDTGELIHEGGTHVEPLVPVHGGIHMGQGGGIGHGGIEIGHGGGGMEHAMGMMHPMGAIDMDHGGGHHGPDIHAPMHHDDHHEHLEPLSVMPSAPAAPAKPAKHKPDIIKVEFVPEEATVEATNKSSIAGTRSKKAGTVRVQFISGEIQENTTEAVTRRNPHAGNIKSTDSATTEGHNSDTSQKVMTVSTKQGTDKAGFDGIKMSVSGGKEEVFI